MHIRILALIAVALLAVCLTTSARPPAPHYTGTALIGGAFTLTDTRGQTIKDSDFRGRLMLVYMGYSHCPDICPMTLGAMGDALTALGSDADKVAPLFISLDPERDTPQALGHWLGAFNPRIIGLTGSKQAVDEAAKTYRIYYKQGQAQPGGGYLIDHSGFLYLMDAEGKYVTHFDADVKAPDLAQALRQHLP